MNTVHVDVVSAEEAIFDGEAEFVALPGEAGELGIYPQHAPLITRIKQRQQKCVAGSNVDIAATDPGRRYLDRVIRIAKIFNIDVVCHFSVNVEKLSARIKQPRYAGLCYGSAGFGLTHKDLQLKRVGKPYPVFHVALEYQIILTWLGRCKRRQVLRQRVVDPQDKVVVNRFAVVKHRRRILASLQSLKVWNLVVEVDEHLEGVRLHHLRHKVVIPVFLFGCTT